MYLQFMKIVSDRGVIVFDNNEKIRYVNLRKLKDSWEYKHGDECDLVTVYDTTKNIERNSDRPSASKMIQDIPVILTEVLKKMKHGDRSYMFVWDMRQEIIHYIKKWE